MVVKHELDNTKTVTSANSMQYSFTENPTSQINPNKAKKNDWHSLPSLVNQSDASAYAYFTKKTIPATYKEEVTKDKNGKKVVKKVVDKYKTVWNVPYTLALSDFHLDIPSYAYLYRITFKVCMKVDSNVDVLAPIGDFRINTPLSSKKYDDTDKKGYSTGWNDGRYLVVPKNTKLQKTFTEHTYYIDEEDIHKAKYTASNLNANIMGLDLIWQNAWTNTDGHPYNADGKVYIKYVKCIVEYDVPNYQLSISNPVADAYKTFKYTQQFDGTESSPYYVACENDFPLSVHCTNNSKAKGGNPNINITIPWGTSLTNATVWDGTYSNGVWTVPAKSYCDYKLDLMLRGHKTGLSDLEASYQNTASYYYRTTPSKIGGFDTININAKSEIRCKTKSCIGIDVHGTSGDGYLDLVVLTNQSERNVTYTLDESSSDGVEILSQTSQLVNLKVPSGNVEFDANLIRCSYPLFTTDLTVEVGTSDSSGVVSKTFSVLDPYEYVIDFLPSQTNSKLVNHRVVSDVGTNTTIIPIIADEIDSMMVMSDCSLTASVWEDLDYIGCVPLEHLHFDPKSTFKDKLLDSHYKNKRYMGKQLATDEDITLNVRVHPQQVTTLQGLIKMDKPIPINANHKCFEGDALNHRGWAEIYAIKAEKTNEHWYKCDIDVKYLTHNLNTRFKINRGARVNDYDIPSLMSETFRSGTNLSESDYFITETDGTFYYADDYYDEGEYISFNDNERNSFNIDNGQSITVTSKDNLTHNSVVGFTWSSVWIDEIKENDVSRIVRLIDKESKKVVFEYQYDDITKIDDEVTGSVIYRVMNEDGSYTDYNDDITFRFNPSHVTYEDDTVVEDEDADIESGDAHYGSTIQFSIRNNQLDIIDMGFNGREISDTVKLLDGNYIYQVEWINKNDDAETSDVECTFDFSVYDTILTSTYSDKFAKLIVSPFPVANKKVLFTREAEEGTLYYYSDDGEEFSYLVEPYYQYHNGTDLVTNDGVSIFDLNYGYEIVYIQNGLVRMGFNRLNGMMYLGKYDPSIDEYITVSRLHLKKFDDVNLNMISDDKIEVQASDSVFTIYRGHPYIKIKHELEDIFIDTIFNRVWAEQVGNDDAVELPAYWDLLNDKNLLDDCVGGNLGLKSSCVTTEEVNHNDRTVTDLAWQSVPSELFVSTDYDFLLSCTALSSYTDEISLDESSCVFGDYTVEIVDDSTPHHFGSMVGDKPVIQVGDTENLSAELLDYANNRVGSGYDIDFVQKSKQFFLDIAKTGHKNTNWTYNSALTETVGSNYTTISSTNTNTTTGRYLSSTEFTGDFEVQLQFNITYNSNYGAYVGFYGVGRTGWRITVSGWRYIKMGRLNGSFYAKISEDGSTWSDMTASSDDAGTGSVMLMLLLYNGTGSEQSMNYKDLVVNGDLVTSATTSNGVATDTVTGVGYGLIKNVARFNDLESNEYEFLDALFKDMGTSDYSTTGWTNARMTLTRPNNEYTQLVWTGSSNSGVYYRDFTLGGSLCIEFDLNFKKATSSSEIVAIDSTWTLLGKISKSNSNLAENTWHHIKIQLNGATGTIKNDTNDTVISFDCTNANRFIFGCNNANDVVKYRNFVVYKPSRVEPTNVALTGSSSIIQTGDTLTLSAKATGDGGVCTGNRIDFIQKPTSSNTWTKIGSALTDETGTALLNYTGTGSGDVDFKAKYQSIESNTIHIQDNE